MFINDFDVNVPQIPGYRFVRVIGEGGMGIVFLAEREHDGYLSAIKVIQPHFMDDDGSQALARFKRELNVCKEFAHPYIVKVLDGGPLGDKGELFVAMEYLEGETLAYCSRREGGLDEQRCWKTAYHMAEAFEYFHQMDYVHRDLKPANIMLEVSGRTVLLDFGLALVSKLTRLTKTGQFVGTPICIAPEQATDGEIGPWTDIYGLGVTLYFAATGDYPYSAEQAILWMMAKEEIPNVIPLHERVDHISEGYSNIVARCMRADGSHRYQSGGELKKALEELKERKKNYLVESAVEIESVDSSPSNLTSASSAFNSKKLVFSLFLCTLVVFLGSFFFRHEDEVELRPYLAQDLQILQSRLISEGIIPTLPESAELGEVIDNQKMTRLLVRNTKVEKAALGLFYLASVASSQQKKKKRDKSSEYPLLLYDTLLERHDFWSIEPMGKSLKDRVMEACYQASNLTLLIERLATLSHLEKNKGKRMFFNQWLCKVLVECSCWKGTSFEKQTEYREWAYKLAVADMRAYIDAKGAGYEIVDEQLLGETFLSSTEQLLCREKKVLVASLFPQFLELVSRSERAELARNAGNLLKQPSKGNTEVYWNEALLAVPFFEMTVKLADDASLINLRKMDLADALSKGSKSNVAIKIMDSVELSALDREGQAIYHTRRARISLDLTSFKEAYEECLKAIEANKMLGRVPYSLEDLKDQIRVRASLTRQPFK